MYRPPSTNAMQVNPLTGQQTPINPANFALLMLFSSTADDAAIIPLAKAMDPNVQVSDGAQGQGLNVVYGSDGRHITVLSGTDPVSGIAYTTTVGELLFQKAIGPAWNDGNQPPYGKLVLYVDVPGQYAQMNWGTVPVTPAPQPTQSSSPIQGGPPIG